MMADPHAKAHQAIGAYFCAFSALEHELGECIKVVFRLQGHESADAVVAALGDVTKKIELVWTAALAAKNQDGTEPTEEGKENPTKTIKAVFGCNNDRNALAHSRLEAAADGSVVLARLQVKGGELKGKGKPNRWSQTDFQRRINAITKLTKQLERVRSDLSKLNVVPSGWINTNQFWQPVVRQWSPAYLDQASTPPVLRASSPEPPSTTEGPTTRKPQNEVRRGKPSDAQ